MPPRYDASRSDVPGSLLAATKRFSLALDHAIYDKEQEASQDLIYVYDADIVVQSILGLTSWDPSTSVPDVSGLKYVTKALFSVGFLPPAHLLRPHMAELERFVQRVPSPHGLEAGFRAQHLRMLSRQWGLDKHDRRVKEYANDLAALESVIRSEGFEIFVKLELCYGGLAYDRLLRILRHCVFRSDVLTHPPLRPGDPIAIEVAERIVSSLRARR